MHHLNFIITCHALQGDELGERGSGEERFRPYDQTDQHSSRYFNGRGSGDGSSPSGNARARNQMVDGYQTSIRRYGENDGERFSEITEV